MNFLLLMVLFFEIFVGYNAQVSGDFACEEGEEYDTCRSPCEITCDNIRQGTRNKCSPNAPCIPGCFCRRGLVRADDHTCVRPSECIRQECEENEEYLDCGSPCALNCTNLNSPIFCTKPCHRGCFCKPNFVRDSKGKCVEPRKCRSAGHARCPANEEYVRCVNYCNTCFVSEYCQTPYCTPGCDCKPGYFRNTYGQCVTQHQCIAEEYALQQQCGLNEVYTRCVNPCNDCYSRGKCDNYWLNYCTPGCDCKPGFFRNDDGICVPEWNCLRQTQPVCPTGEEYYDCVPTCRVTCDTYHLAEVICDTTCNKGCFCKRGFVRRADGLCVQPSECPARPLPCPQGETLYQCLPTCRTTCRTLNSSRGLCSTECKQGCFCQPGFVRNDSGICVPPSECPLACGSNEEFRICGSACPATCENFRERRVCPQQRCLRGCFCKAGFVLGPRGNCIRPRNCPVEKPTSCCGGIRGRSNANDTDDDDEDTTPVATTPAKTESSSNDSSNATSPSSTSEKIPDKTTPKSGTATTTPKSGADITTPKAAADITTPKAAADITTPKAASDTTTPKAASDTTTPKVAADTTTPKQAADTTTPKQAASTTTPKTADVTTPPKSAAATTTLKPSSAAAATTAMPTTTSAVNKSEETNSTTNATEIPTTEVTEGQTNIP